MGGMTAFTDLTPPVPAFAPVLHHRTEHLGPGEPIAAPLVGASTFAVPGDPALSGAAYQYGRWDSPTWTVLEESLAALEGAPTLAFPSGMAAIAAVLMPLLEAGDRVLLPSDGYGAVRQLADAFLVPRGIRVEHVPTPEVASRDLAGYRMVYLETPSNPGLRVADIAAVAERAHAAGAVVVVDNTTLTPLGQRPLELGADVVVSSDTKAVNGHSDALGGHVSTRDEAVLERVLEAAQRSASGSRATANEASTLSASASNRSVAPVSSGLGNGTVGKSASGCSCCSTTRGVAKPAVSSTCSAGAPPTPCSGV